MSTEASLYIHVPFCAGKCDYCDFYSVPLKKADNTLQGVRSEDPRLDAYVDVLLSDAESIFTKYKPQNVPSIYIGGGTPSILGPERIYRLTKSIMRIISRYADIKPKEITVEANPESVSKEFMEASLEGGVNRLSIGIQSFHIPSRKAVNRVGSDETRLENSLSLAREFFTECFSVDLISGFPLQTEKILLDDIEKVLEYSPSHVSLYSLTVEPGTPLADRNISKKDRDDNNPDKADKLWLAGRDALDKAGFSQYEVSNFCKPGKESLHNIRYWRLENWLALGPGSSGTIIPDHGQAYRYTIPADVDAWLSAGSMGNPHSEFFPQIEELDEITLIKESLLMGFRYIEGPCEDLFNRRFRKNIRDLIPETLKKWQSCMQNDKLALNKEGLLFLNSFLVDVFRELS